MATVTAPSGAPIFITTVRAYRRTGGAVVIVQRHGPVCGQPTSLPYAQGMDYYASPATLAHIWCLAARQRRVLDLGAAGIGRVLAPTTRPEPSVRAIPRASIASPRVARPSSEIGRAHV